MAKKKPASRKKAASKKKAPPGKQDRTVPTTKKTPGKPRTRIAPRREAGKDPASRPLTFEQMLPRLTAAYERGLLVPFIGAGMSVPVCTGWETFITKLERAAGTGGPGRRSRKKASSDELVRRANDAVRRLKLRGSKDFIDAVSKALIQRPKGGEQPRIPAQTRKLAEIYWPLVLTTNYDDLFVTAWNTLHKDPDEDMTTVGRAAVDCHKVLASLGNPRAPLSWALQGFLPGIAKVVRPARVSLWKRVTGWVQEERRRGSKRARDAVLAGQDLMWPWSAPAEQEAFSRVQEERHLEALRDELVVGHEEYRRVAFAQPLFRRAFAEVFRARSFFFLGSSLGEQYFLNLFGEVLEIYGANPVPHYALVQKSNALDEGFLRSRFNIFVHRYESHDELPGLLEKLRMEIDGRAKAKSSLHFTVPCGAEKNPWSEDRLEISASDFDAATLKDGECVLVEGEREPEGLSLLPASRKLLESGQVRLSENPGRAELEKNGVFLFGPPEARRGLDWFARAVEEALDRVPKDRSHRIHVLWRKPGFSWSNPARFKAIETIRAYGRWVRHLRRKPPTIVLHVADSGLFVDLRSGRIDPNELVRCEDVRFWIEIHPIEGSPIVEIYQGSDQERVLDVAKAMGVPQDQDWFVEVTPPTVYGGPVNLRKLADPEGAAADEEKRPWWVSAFKPRTADLPETLAALGVLPDSSLLFIQVPKKDRDAAESIARTLQAEAESKLAGKETGEK